MPLKPQSAKNKGRRFQQKIAASILKAFPHLKEDDCFSTSMGAPGEDIRLSPLARQSVPLSIECKCQEKLNVWSCLQQAENNCPTDANPTLIFSRNRSETYAVVKWDYFLSLLTSRASNTNLPQRLTSLIKELQAFVPEDTNQNSVGNPPSP